MSHESLPADTPREAARREVFERAVHARYPAASAAGARLTLRRDAPGSSRYGQYVAEHIEFAWVVFCSAQDEIESRARLVDTGVAAGATLLRPATRPPSGGPRVIDMSLVPRNFA